MEDVSLTVNSGDCRAAFGPNGAGKTTTFYMVVGIVPRGAGNIIIDDEDISLLPLHCAILPRYRLFAQETSIFPPNLSVFDNLMAVLQIRERFDRRTARRPRQRADGRKFHIGICATAWDERCRW